MGMLAAEIAVREILANDAGISELLGARIYPAITPQNPAFPLAVYGLRNTERFSHLTGAENAANKTIRIDIYAETYAGVKAVTELIATLLHGYSGTVVKDDDFIQISMILQDEESDSEPVLIRPGADEFVYAVNMAFNVWY